MFLYQTIVSRSLSVLIWKGSTRTIESIFWPCTGQPQGSQQMPESIVQTSLETQADLVAFSAGSFVSCGCDNSNIERLLGSNQRGMEAVWEHQMGCFWNCKRY